MGERADGIVGFLAGMLGVAALAEFFLLRTGTRTLIHIPGLGRFEAPIEILAEVGRLAYYLAVVLLVLTLGYLAGRQLSTGTSSGLWIGGLVGGFLLVAFLARLGLMSSAMAGWLSLALLGGLTLLLWQGARWIPVGLFSLSSIAAGWSVLGQGDGGGLSGSAVDTLIVLAEITLLSAALTSPLLMGHRPTGSSLVAGGMAALVTALAFATGGSTLSILVLWNIGVPGWLPGLAYALGVGALTTAVWLGVSSGARLRVIALVLLLAGGVGVISTYQTGLVFAALLVIGEAQARRGSVAPESLSPPAIEFEDTGASLSAVG